MQPCQNIFHHRTLSSAEPNLIGKKGRLGFYLQDTSVILRHFIHEEITVVVVIIMYDVIEIVYYL
jgi:hypothetical protein